MDEITYYSVQEFAKKVGVSRQSIYKVLSTKLSTYVVNQGDKIMLRAEALCEYSCQPSVNQGNTLVDTKSSTENEPLYEILRQELEHKNKLIDDLKNELSEERKHSREQSERIATLASQAQYLQLEQKIEKDIPPSKSVVNTTEAHEDSKEKVGFWKKWFEK